VAKKTDSFHAVCGIRIPNGDYGLALKKSMVPLMNRCTLRCAQREDCKTSVNSENLHVSLVTAVFRELQLDFFNISSNNLTINIGSDNRSYCSTKISRISHADVWMRTGLKIIALFAGNEPISGEACDKEEEIMASRVDVGCTKPQNP